METPPPGPPRGELRSGLAQATYRSTALASAIDTPASPSPRHSTPAEGPSFQDTPAAPIAKPQFRTLPDGEIILEEAGAALAASAAAAAAGGAAAAAAGGSSGRLARLSLPPQQPPQQQHEAAGGSTAGVGGSRDLEGPKAPSKQREMLVIASRSTTVMAQPSLKHATLPGNSAEAAAAAANGGEARLHQQQQEGTAPDDDAAASSEPASRMRYRPTLTQENVQHLAKLEQYSARPDPTERMWRWLEDAGPPYEGSPSVGVPSKAVPGPDAAASAHHTPRRFWCFGCFGGDR
ncbi:hypothetical protein N2152v2_006270 [Parachlorella kessleri]